MIRAALHHREDRWELQVLGHAGTAPHGQDLVCAAVTALVYTLGQYLQQLYEQGLLKAPPDIRLSPGAARLTACGNAPEVGAAFGMTCTGLRLLQESYPQNVKAEQT